MPYRSAWRRCSLGSPNANTARTIALSALNRPSRATRRPTVKKSEGVAATSITDSVWISNLTRLVSMPICSDRRNLMPVDHDDFYFISMAARMLNMHPQTLRKYERLGLVRPSRTLGSMRLYSRDELERLKLIKRLVDDGGINLAGVQRLLSIAEVVQRIRPLVTSSTAR